MLLSICSCLTFKFLIQQNHNVNIYKDKILHAISKLSLCSLLVKKFCEFNYLSFRVKFHYLTSRC